MDESVALSVSPQESLTMSASLPSTTLFRASIRSASWQEEAPT